MNNMQIKYIDGPLGHHDGSFRVTKDGSVVSILSRRFMCSLCSAVCDDRIIKPQMDIWSGADPYIPDYIRSVIYSEVGEFEVHECPFPHTLSPCNDTDR